MEITVSIKTVYGNESIYPACDKSAIFAKIAGTKTLTRDCLANIQALGYEVKVQPVTL